MAQHVRPAGTGCIGSRVPGHVFEHGHSILPGTETQMFPARADRENTYSPIGLRVRCVYCQSVLYHYRREDGHQKAATSLRAHLRKIVDRGFAVDKDQARAGLVRNGVTTDLVAAMFRKAFNQPCPGLCCEVIVTDGKIVRLEPHIITQWSDLHLDWQDPRFPMTPENIGPLDATCNQQKGEKPWPEFIARQRAIRANLLGVTPNAPPPEQFRLF